MGSGWLTAILLMVLFVGFFVVLIRLIVKSNQKQRLMFVTFAQSLGANAEVSPDGRASVQVVVEGRAVRVFMAESNRFRYANLEMAVKNSTLELEFYNARPFQQSETPTGRSDFDAAFHIRSNDPAAARELFTEDLCRLLLQTQYEHDSHSAWKISQGRLHYRALPPVSQYSSGLENPEFHERFRTALRAAANLAARIGSA